MLTGPSRSNSKILSSLEGAAGTEKSRCRSTASAFFGSLLYLQPTVRFDRFVHMKWSN